MKSKPQRENLCFQHVSRFFSFSSSGSVPELWCKQFKDCHWEEIEMESYVLKYYWLIDITIIFIITHVSSNTLAGQVLEVKQQFWNEQDKSIATRSSIFFWEKCRKKELRGQNSFIPLYCILFLKFQMDLLYLEQQTITGGLLMLDIFTKHMLVVAIQSEGEGILPPEWLNYCIWMVRQLWTPLDVWKEGGITEQKDTLIFQRRQYEHTKICFMSG